MKTWVLLGASLGATLVLASCVTRSISDSDYAGGSGGHSSRSMAYQGELTEWDVLGTTSTNATAVPYAPVALTNGERVLVIQSGAFFPDDEMVRELQARFNVAMFSGIPPKEKGAAFAERVRSAALNGGCARLLVYWGILEIAQRDQATQSISWVPLVGQFVPDSRQTVRIRVKAFVVDANSGHWSMVLADSFQDERLSAPVVRAGSHQEQVARLKALAYRNLVAKLR